MLSSLVRINQQPGDDEIPTTGIIDLEARFYAEVESLVDPRHKLY